MIDRGLHTFLVPAACFLAITVAGPAAQAQFDDGDLFVSSPIVNQVRIYDPNTLAFKSSFSHPEFLLPDDGPLSGNMGIAFNQRGNLVVSATFKFIEFSAPGVEFATYDKAFTEPTETVLFDRLGNLYTSTQTGGTNRINQYRESDYSFVQTILLAGHWLTGMTFDDQDRLFVASQLSPPPDANVSRVYVLQADPTFSNFVLSHEIVSVNGRALEGLQINQAGELIAAGGDIQSYDSDTGAALGVFDAPNDNIPVPLIVDRFGNIYTSDYEDETGSQSADLFKFSPDGSSFITANDPNLFGPIAMAVAGSNVPGSQQVPVSREAMLLLAGLLGLLLTLQVVLRGKSRVL